MLILSMGASGAEDKPKHGQWERCNLQWEDEFEYFDHTRWGLDHGVGHSIAF